MTSKLHDAIDAVLKEYEPKAGSETEGIVEGVPTAKAVMDSVEAFSSCLSQIGEVYRDYQTSRSLCTVQDDLLSDLERQCLLWAWAMDQLWVHAAPGESSASAWTEGREKWVNKYQKHLLVADGSHAPIAARIWRASWQGAPKSNTIDGSQQGGVREQCCGALLALLSHIVGIRRKAQESSFDGNQSIRDVVIDLYGGLVKVVLGEWFDSVNIEDPTKTPHAVELRTIRDRVAACSESLHRVRASLAAIGLPVREWCIEHNGRLFDGSESCRIVFVREPALSSQYLERVLEAMWTLSTRLFGEGVISYDDLADYMREPVLGRVKSAAHRIHVETGATPGPLFWLGRDAWQLRGSATDKSDNIQKPPEWARDALKNLGPRP